MNKEKNDSEKTKAILCNSNQDEIEDKYNELGKTDLEIDEDLFTFDQNNEAQRSNFNQEKIGDKNNALEQKDEANEDNKENANQEEIEDSYNGRVRKDSDFYKEINSYKAKENNTEENKSEILEVKSTGEGSMIVEEKNSIVVLKREDNVKDIIKNPGETNNNFSSEKNVLNSFDNKNKNKELNSGSSPNQSEKPNNGNIILIPEEENNYDSENNLIGNKIKRENELSEEEEYNNHGIEFNKDNSLYDMIKSYDEDITENQIINSTMTSSNRKRFNTELSKRVNESDFLTRGHVSSGLYQHTCYTNSILP